MAGDEGLQREGEHTRVLEDSSPSPARDLDAMRRLQRLGTRHVSDGDIAPVLGEVVDAAIAIAGADFGNIQLYDAESGSLRIVAQRGFPQWWLDFWDSVGEGQGVCGTALAAGERVIVEDVEQSSIFIGKPALQAQLKAGVRAVQSTPLFSRSGEPLGMLSTHYRSPHRPDDHSLALLDLLAGQAADIIARTRAEEALREGEERLRHHLENTPLAVVEWDSRFVVTRWSGEAERMFGYSADETLGKKIQDLHLVHREDLPAVERTMAQLTDGRHTRVVAVNRNITKDGRVIDCTWFNSVLMDQRGRMISVMSQVLDSTERVQAERLLRESEKRYRTIVELADEDLTVSDDGTYSFRATTADDVSERGWQFRTRLIATAAAARRHRPLTLLIAIVFELAFLIPMGFAPTSRHVLGLPGSVLTLIVVVTAVLTSWQGGLAAAIVGGFIFWAAVADFGAEAAPVTTVISTAVWATAGLITGFLSDALRDQTRRRKNAAVALARAETQREQEAAQAAQEERTRIARDLHDSVTQSLFAAALKAEALALASSDEDPRISSAAEVVERLNRGALAQMRTLLLELRGGVVAEMPIDHLLRNLAEAAEGSAGVAVALTLGQQSRLPSDVHEAVYRIVQETLNNIVRHSGAANAWIRLDSGPTSARLVIGDDGCGFDAGSVDLSHFGLKSMKGRATDSGGRLELKSVPGEGTIVTAEWRYEPEGTEA